MILLDKTGLERLWSHILSKLSDKVDKIDGKGLSTNDYTTEEKEKLAGVDSLIDNAISEASTDAVTEGSTALITSGAVHTALSNVSVDTSSLVQKSGDTMEGVLVADEISVADLSVAQVRNIWAGIDAPEDLTIAWKEGDIYLRYEVES